MSAVQTFSTVRTEIKGVSIQNLAKSFGTPTYVYDAAKIAQRIADLRAFDVVRYAQKANSNLAVLDWVRRQGAVVDSVSAFEIQRAFAAGFVDGKDPPEIVFTADIFDQLTLELLVKHTSIQGLD